MKKIYSLITAIFLSLLLFGQSPSSFKYQAVLRNVKGEIRANADATILIEIVQNPGNVVVYSETHKIKTDNFGLIDLVIGKGTAVTGNFSMINWSDGSYSANISVDGVSMGSNQFHSVPYALYAEKAGNSFSGNYDDLTDKPVLFDGAWSSLTGKPAFSTIATTGSYNDLTNKPALFDGTWTSLSGKPSLATVATSGNYADLTNKPAINGSETKITAGTNVTVAGNGTDTNPYVINSFSYGTGSPGTTIGDMQYWNGTTWVLLPPGQPGQSLKLSSSGEPFWDGIKLPTVTTLPVTSITAISAKCGADIICGSEFIGGVCLSTSPNPTITDKTFQGININNIYLTGLKALTTYHLRAYATNTAGTAYGNEISFTTASATRPKIASYLNVDPYNSNSQVSWTTALIGVEITSDGGIPITSNGVCWSTTPDPTIAHSKTNDPTGENSFVSQITGLSVFTTYFVRAYAINSLGITYGDEMSFTTKQLEIPVINTLLPNIITHTMATGGGDVLSDGGTAITARGVCWNTTTNPTTANSKTTETPGSGTFTSSLTGLTANTTYYARAYATNSLGTGYGDEIKFTTHSGTVTDVEGTVYNTVSIGTQVWMAENLKTKKYNNGDLIGSISLDITAENEPKYQWAYEENESNTAVYGRLYTWYAITDSRKICPTGWHVPTQAEWTTLNTFVGGSLGLDGAIKLKEAGSAHWLDDRTGPGSQENPNNGTNETGFTALPGGSRSGNGSFAGLGGTGKWWTSSEYIGSSAWYRTMTNYVHSGWYNNIAAFSGSKRDGLSVRCIKD